MPGRRNLSPREVSALSSGGERTRAEAEEVVRQSAVDAFPSSVPPANGRTISSRVQFSVGDRVIGSGRTAPTIEQATNDPSRQLLPAPITVTPNQRLRRAGARTPDGRLTEWIEVIDEHGNVIDQSPPARVDARNDAMADMTREFEQYRLTVLPQRPIGGDHIDEWRTMTPPPRVQPPRPPAEQLRMRYEEMRREMLLAPQPLPEAPRLFSSDYDRWNSSPPRAAARPGRAG